MDHPTDYINRSIGVKALECDDTMIMGYCCMNSTSRISLSLKDLTYNYLGDYAVDVKEVLELPPEDLYRYNALDCVGTFHIYNKFNKMLDDEDQREVYETILQPSINYLANMMLSGLPISKERITAATEDIQARYDKAYVELQSNDIVKLAIRNLKMDASVKYNETHKVKQKTPDEFDIEFNPNSSKQLQLLIFDLMNYTPLDYTPKGAPKTNRAAIEEFRETEHSVERLEVLDAIIAISETGIILSTFLSTFDDLWFDATGDDDLGRLYGNQRIGGTLSGRLSSNSPNFANLPSGSAYGKAIKNCFVAPEGFLFVASDYAALEDRVGAQVTGDINKRKEFLEGFDGHSLRAYAFFKEEIDEALGEELDPTDPASINRIKDELPDIRAKSKSPSFAMAYGSGAGKIKDLLKCSKGDSERVFAKYHELYRGTAKYAEKSIAEAKRQGYTTGAYGLKLRTPKINSSDGKIAGSEGRTLNNMRIQSYGLLMNQAGIDLQRRIEDAGLETDVILVNQIHDALYLLVRNTAEIIKWVNDNLVEVMIADYVDGQIIHNEAETDWGHDWKVQHTMKNDMSLKEVQEFLREHEL